jgi:hypothetical protein
VALNLIGPWEWAAEKVARSLAVMQKERSLKKYDVQMETLRTFAGDLEEGVHPRGSLFFTTESRARKYEMNLPRLALRVANVEVRSGTIRRTKPAIKPEETKAVKRPAAKKLRTKKTTKR